MKRSARIIAGLGIILLFALTGMTGTRAVLSLQQTDQDGRASGAASVAVASPKQRRMEETITATGTMMPVRAVQLVPDAPGRVTGIPVSSGQRVAAGDLLIQLDDRAARAALADAEATLRETQQTYTRIERLAESNAAAEAQLESARAALHRAEAAVMAADIDFDNRTITAPFDGILGVIDIDEGAYIDGTTPVTRLSDLSSVEVSASLPERYFENVRPGQTLEVTTPAYPGETFEGRITLRAPEIDRDTRSFEIRAEIANPDRRLASGMFARSRLLLRTYDGVAIPDAAIITEGLKSYVYTVADGTATRTDIEPGKSLGDMTEVRSGMSLEDRVVVAGWDRLSGGATVRIDEQGGRETAE